MANNKTDFLESALINHIFGGTSFTAPTAWYLAIYDVDPGEAVTSASPAALTSQRVQITSWNRSGNTATNANNMQFDPVPGGATWVVSHFAIFNATTGGSPLYYGPLSATKTVSAGDILFVAANQISVSEL